MWLQSTTSFALLLETIQVHLSTGSPRLAGSNNILSARSLLHLLLPRSINPPPPPGPSPTLHLGQPKQPLHLVPIARGCKGNPLWSPGSSAQLFSFLVRKHSQGRMLHLFGQLPAQHVYFGKERNIGCDLCPLGTAYFFKRCLLVLDAINPLVNIGISSWHKRFQILSKHLGEHAVKCTNGNAQAGECLHTWHPPFSEVLPVFSATFRSGKPFLTPKCLWFSKQNKTV